MDSNASPAGRDALLAWFADHGIDYQRCDHPAVLTTAEAEQLVPPLPGAKAKNLFIRDKAHGRYFLVLVPYAKRVDLAALSSQVEAKKLRLATAPELLQFLGITPGAVSILALFNDRACRVELVVDTVVWQADPLQCHPLVNTSTLVIPKTSLARFLSLTGHTPRVLDVPGL